VFHSEFIHNPVDDSCQCLGFHRTTGFADGRQRAPSPVLHTALLQRAHQQTIRCADKIHVAGLPLAAAHLTIAQPQLLLPVSMKRLGPCPTMPIHQDHPHHFPPQTITHQRCACLLGPTLSPKQQDLHGHYICFSSPCKSSVLTKLIVS